MEAQEPPSSQRAGELPPSAAARAAEADPERPSQIPRPSLTGMDPVVQQQLTTSHDELDRLLAVNRSPPGEGGTGDGQAGDRLASALGEMGQLYLAYDLVEPAAACLNGVHQLQPAEFRWPYLLGALYQNDGHLDKAVSAFEAALVLRPGDLPSWVRLGNVRLAQGEVDLAKQAFDRALQIDGRAAAALAGLARSLLAQGEPQLAVEHLRSALQLQPQASALRYPLGVALRELGRLDEARAELAQRGQTEPFFPDPLAQELTQLTTGAGVQVMLGNRALRKGSYDAAVSRFQQALEIDPRHLGANRAMAGALSRRGDLDGAVRHYSAALAVDPDDPALRYNLGTVLIEQGEDAQAVRHLEAALERAPDYVNARFNLAGALGRLGRFAQATQHYRALVEMEPEDFASRFYLAQSLLQLGRDEEAAALFETLRERWPERARVRLGLGRAYANLGRREEALAELRATVQAVQDQTDAQPPDRDEPATASADEVQPAVAAHLAAADLLLQAEQQQLARAELEAALRWRPEDPELLRRVAFQLARAQLYEAAQELFERAVSAQPRNGESRVGLAMVLLLGERYEQALRSLEQGVAVLPRAPQLVHLLARFLATCPQPELRDGQRALELAQGLMSSAPSPDVAETMAMALAELGRFEEAVRWQQRVVQRLGASGAQGATAAARQRLTRYQQGQASRAPWLGS